MKAGMIAHAMPPLPSSSRPSSARPRSSSWAHHASGQRLGTSVFGATVEHVLKRAPCRVMLIGAAPIEVYAVNAAA